GDFNAKGRLAQWRCYNSYNPIKANYSMEALKIAVTCVIAAVLDGILHDQITVRICIEYFIIFHPPLFTPSLRLCSASDGDPMLLSAAMSVLGTTIQRNDSA